MHDSTFKSRAIASQTMPNTVRPRLHVIHGFVSVLAWGVLVPLGVFLARFGKPAELADVGARFEAQFRHFGPT